MVNNVDGAHDPLIVSLMRAEAYDHPTHDFKVLETHISWVILTGEFAYKIKKPVNFGFVDFSTLERRHHFCQEELRLNLRFTHDLYLAVKPIYGPLDNASFCGSGEPVEFAVKLNQFAQADLLPNVLERGELRPDHLEQFASRLARFQSDQPSAEATDSFGSGRLLREEMLANIFALSEEQTHELNARQLQDWTDHEFAQCEARFAQRKHDGKIRDGHGDLHLGNLILRQDTIEVFDCIEFNPELRWIDVISEVAFLVMDLVHRNQAALGWRFINIWLADTGDYAGLEVWAWYFCYRALVRVKVGSLRLKQTDLTSDEVWQVKQQIHEYLVLVRRVIERPEPILFITHGVSGSGKSHFAKQLAAEFGLIWIRSDVERKRLFDQRDDGATDSNLYSSEKTMLTYRHLKELAKTVLQSRWSVLVDATFLSRAQRNDFHVLSHELGIRICLLEFAADEQTIRRRIVDRQSRGADASDATEAVLDYQLRSSDPIDKSEGWSIISCHTDQPDAEGKLYAAVREVISADN